MIQTLYPAFRYWSYHGSVFIISDTHFADEDCKLMDPAWPSPEEQVEIINKKVTKNDTLIILGDIGDVSYVSQIRAGLRVLIKGNHDSGNSNYMLDFTVSDFESRKEASMAKKAGCIMTYMEDSHGRIQGYKTNGLFDEIYDGPLFISDKILLSHEPIHLDFALNIHGHCHGGPLYDTDENGKIWGINLASNVAGYVPMSLGDIVKEGYLKEIKSIHRLTVDGAIEAKKEN